MKKPHKGCKKSLIESFGVAPVLYAVKNIYEPISWQLMTKYLQCHCIAENDFSDRQAGYDSGMEDQVEKRFERSDEINMDYER